MRWVKMSIQIISEQYIWLKKHSDKTGESMNTIIRWALNEYKSKN